MRQFPYQPGHRHQLNPVAGKRQHIANRKQRKISVAEQLSYGCNSHLDRSEAARFYEVTTT